MSDGTISGASTFSTGARVSLGYALAGRRVRSAGAITGRAADGRICVGFDDGGSGCFTPGALLTALPGPGQGVGDAKAAAARAT